MRECVTHGSWSCVSIAAHVKREGQDHEESERGKTSASQTLCSDHQEDWGDEGSPTPDMDPESAAMISRQESVSALISFPCNLSFLLKS